MKMITAFAKMMATENASGGGGSIDDYISNDMYLQSASSIPTSPILTGGPAGELFACVLFAVSAIVLATKIPPDATKRPLPYQQTKAGDMIRDLRLDQELVPVETVPNEKLGIFGIVLPVVAELLLIASFGLNREENFYGILCANAIAFGLTEFTSGYIKRYAGYLRPNAYEKTKFDLPNEDDPTVASDHSCTSFPSGHSSTSFCGLTLLSCFARYLFSQEFASSTPTWQRAMSIASLLPLGLAVYVASSRVYDNYHHPADVVCGALIGFGSANFAFKLWFP